MTPDTDMLLDSLRPLLVLLLLAPLADARQLPREDVVAVPAMGAGLWVSNLFQTNMVLQRDEPTHIWGWARPGEEVTVTFADQRASATAGADRRWLVTLPALPASAKPRDLVVAGEREARTLENVLVGDVWVLGGQSNMEFELAKVENGWLEIVSANLPELRILTVPYGIGPDPTAGFARLDEWSDWFGRHFRKGDWDVCTPDKVKELSAIGYAFARRVHMASGVPIGVIDASRGGTTVETWTPLDVLQEIESEVVQAKLAQWEADVAAWDPEADLAQRVERNRAWVQQQVDQGNEVPEDRKQDPSDLQPGPIGNHNHPGHCYAGMIAPLAGLSIKGVIFHQGYNNAFEGSVGVDLYRNVFPALIEAWRAAFDDPKLPFGILSLCTDGYPQTRDDYCEKMLNTGIEIRAAQYQAFLDLRAGGDDQVGFASTYDLRRRWYHPQVKLPAGERIARWALATQYGLGQNLHWKPPLLVGMEQREGALVLQLDMDVMDPEDGAIEGFAIAGEDRRFHPADVAYAEKGKDDRGRVQVDRKRLVLTSPMVPEPVHFRYAWGRNPMGNLQATGNRDLPFATQRSDNWEIWEVPGGVFEAEVALPLSRGDRNKLLQALREQDRARRLDEARRVIESEGQRK